MKYTDEMRIGFGKYIGKPLGDIPRGYLQYLYDRNIGTKELREYIIETIPMLRALRDKANDSIHSSANKPSL